MQYMRAKFEHMIKIGEFDDYEDNSVCDVKFEEELNCMISTFGKAYRELSHITDEGLMAKMDTTAERFAPPESPDSRTPF